MWQLLVSIAMAPALHGIQCVVIVLLSQQPPLMLLRCSCIQLRLARALHEWWQGPACVFNPTAY